MLLKQLAEGFAEDAHAAAVNHADARQACKKCAVDELFDFLGGFVDGLADYIDFAGDSCALVFERDGDAAGAGGFHGRVFWLSRGIRADQHFGNVVAGDLHFHRAHFYFEMIVIGSS